MLHTGSRVRGVRRSHVGRATGMVLPAVVAVGAAIAALTGAWFEAALTEARRTRALSDRLIAFHAADAALAVCVTRLQHGTARYLGPTSRTEPGAWRRASALAMPDAIEPFAAWPMAAQPPRCLIEAWDLRRTAGDRAYLVTARGVGSHASTTVWLQMQILMREGRIVARRWRRVAAAG
nr:hypothetical protein [Burkholderia guangdongensis]